MKEIEATIKALETRAGQEQSRIEQRSHHTGRAWKWYNAHKDLFDKEVFGPPMVTCSIKDARYTQSIETLFNNSSWLILTTQTKKDYDTLSRHLTEDLGLAQFTIRCVTETWEQFIQRAPPRMTREQLRQVGLDGYATDFIDAPEPVMVMMCEQMKLHTAGITLRELSHSQFDAIAQSSLNNWVAGDYVYTKTGRAEFGPSAVSTRADRLKPAQVFSAEAVDSTPRQAMETEIKGLKQNMLALRERNDEYRKQLEQIETQIKQEEAAIVSHGLPIAEMDD